MVPPFVVCRGCPGFGHSDSSRGCRNRQPQLKGSAAAREILCPWTMRSSKTRVPCHHDSLTSGHVRAITSRLAPEARSQPPCARVRAHRKGAALPYFNPLRWPLHSLAGVTPMLRRKSASPDFSNCPHDCVRIRSSPGSPAWYSFSPDAAQMEFVFARAAVSGPSAGIPVGEPGPRISPAYAELTPTQATAAAQNTTARRDLSIVSPLIDERAPRRCQA
jgi:hypothetical protein